MYNAKHPPEDNEMNPVHQNTDGLWYFWDESWSIESKGYAKENEAHHALIEYAKSLDMTLNQQAVLHFLDALQKYHPWLYKLILVYSDSEAPEDILRTINEGWVRKSNIPATWVNQARQAAILLQGVK